MTIVRPTLCEVCGNLLTGRQIRFCSEECTKIQRRWTWIEKVYGLTPDDFDLIMMQQGWECAICGRPFKDYGTGRGGAGWGNADTPWVGVHVDHEHGAHVRGLLCAYCNTRLVGRLKDHELAQRLADYLREPPAVKALGREVIAPGRPKRKRGKRRVRKGQGPQGRAQGREEAA